MGYIEKYLQKSMHMNLKPVPIIMLTFAMSFQYKIPLYYIDKSLQKSMYMNLPGITNASSDSYLSTFAMSS